MKDQIEFVPRYTTAKTERKKVIWTIAKKNEIITVEEIKESFQAKN